MNQIHPTAVVAADVELGGGVTVGPYVVIEPEVVVGPRCHLAAHVVLKQGTVLGADNHVSEGAVLGGRPQHLHAQDEIGVLHIGNGNTIRENVTIHAALEPGHATRIGDCNMIMANAHIAHDCRIGHHTILANNVLLAGHVVVDDFAYLSGAAAAHQFCRIGRHSMVGGQSHIKADVLPFVTVDGFTSKVVGLNVIGLRRRGFSAAQIEQLKQAYRIIFQSGLAWETLLAELERTFTAPPATQMLEFLRTTQRGYVRARKPASKESVSLRVVGEDSDEAATSIPIRKAG